MQDGTQVVSTIGWERVTGEEPMSGTKLWHGNQRQGRAPHDIYVTLREDLRVGKLGWTLQLGTANEAREVALVEVLALLPENADTLKAELVGAHLDLIDSATSRVMENGLEATQTASREQIDSAVSMLRDVARLRREAQHARGVGSRELSATISSSLGLRPPE
jgi:hypothetical protein